MEATPITGGMFTPDESLTIAEGLLLEAMGEGAPLDRLDLLAQAAGHLDAATRGGVVEAREQGASWAQIAGALGLASKQAAAQRYGRSDA